MCTHQMLEQETYALLHVCASIGKIAYITFTQTFSGVAKDLVKLSGKSVSKLSSRSDDKNDLFRLVAYITGAKNAIKGVGTSVKLF